MVKLRDIFSLQMGKTPSRKEDRYWTRGEYPWVSIADMSGYRKHVGLTKEYITHDAIEESGIKIVPANTVIMSFKLSIGKVAITCVPVYTNEAIMAFIPKKNNVVKTDYLFYMLSSKNWNIGTNRAVMGATLNKVTLGELNIQIPDMEQQTEVVVHLDKLCELIEKRKKQLIILDQLVKSRHVGEVAA